MKKIKVLLLFLVCSYSFGQVGPMLSEGPIPKELWSSIDNYDKSKSDMLGIVDILKNGQIIYGNAAHKMIERIGKKLLEGNPRAAEVKFFIIRSNLYNAFATDQGYIFATTAMLAQSSSEDEIAFVLGHELSHFLLKHTTQSRAVIPSKLYDYQVKRRKAEKLNESVKKMKELDVEFDELIKSLYQFKQEQELSADSLGAILYHKAGYSKNGLLIAISNLQTEYPIFHKYNFNYKCLTNNLTVPYFDRIMTDSCDNYNAFKLRAEKFKYAIIFDEEDKNMDYTFSTHPSWVKRLNQIKKMSVKFDFTHANSALLPLEKELNLDILEELYTHNFITGKYFLAMAYANLLYQKDSLNIDYVLLNRIAQSAISIKYMCKKHPQKLTIQKFVSPNLLNQIQELFFTNSKTKNIHWSFSQIKLQEGKPLLWIEQLRASYQAEITKFMINYASYDSIEITRCKIKEKFEFPPVFLSDSSEILKNIGFVKPEYANEEELNLEDPEYFRKSDRNSYFRYYLNPGILENNREILSIEKVNTMKDTIFQVAPKIVYLDRPKKLSNIKEMQYSEFYASEIQSIAKQNNLVIKGVHSDDSFSTEEYNKDYLGWLQVSDRINHEYNAMPYSGITDQLFHTNYKYLIRTTIVVINQQRASVGDRLLTYYTTAIGLPFGFDFGSIFISGPRKTVVIQEVIGLDSKMKKANFVYTYGLRINKAVLSVFVQNSLKDVHLILKAF